MFPRKFWSLPSPRERTSGPRDVLPHERVSVPLGRSWATPLSFTSREGAGGQR